MYGKRRMLLIRLVLLVAGSVTAALSDSPAPMISGRRSRGPDTTVTRALHWAVFHITLPEAVGSRTGIRYGPPIRKDPLSTALPQLRGGLPQCGGARIRTWEG
ncbi:hypothetical protein GCM10010256_65030 [Streptomyces coeruleorubidus]|nr:hypothetical protein GCM10010256_65030 [Streptomyces coeruleorubidus]